MDQNLRIQGERCYLRPMTDEDTDLIVKWRNNPRVRNNFIYQKPFTAEGHRQWVETKVKTGQVIQFVICLPDGKPVGSVYFRDIDKEHQNAEYGIFIGEDDAVGKGIGSEVCKLSCAYCFEHEGWHKIRLRVLAENKSAARTYEKAGFKQEAYLRDEVFLGGSFHDVIFMGMLKDDLVK